MRPSTRRLRRPIDGSGLFGVELALAGCGLLAVAVAISSSVRSVALRPARGRQVEVLHQRFTYPYANAAAVVVLLLALLGLAVVARGLRAVLREFLGQRRFLRDVARRNPRLRGEAFIVDGAQPEAFCAGLLRPRVYISRGAVDALDAPQLQAVLAHESHHCRRRDPLRHATLRVLARALFFLPVLQTLSDRSLALAELGADDAAVKAAGGRPTALAGAMVTFHDSTHPVGSVGIAPGRIDRLMGREVVWRAPILVVGCAVVTALLLGGLAWRVGRSALIETTLSPPFFSRQPCIVVLALLPGTLAFAAVRLLRR